MKNKEKIIEIAKSEDSFYLYDGDMIDHNVNLLKNSFHGIEFLFSLKSNSMDDVVSNIIDSGFGIDAASLGEVEIGVRYGLNKNEIFYSAPGKTYSDIFNSINKSIIIVDSIDEIYKVNKAAKEKDMIAKIGVRINPNFTYTSNNGISSKFGIDQDIFFSNIEMFNVLDNVQLVGIHIHIMSQELSTVNLMNYHKNVLKLAKMVVKEIDRDLEFINFGSGIGITIAISDVPVNIEVLGNSLAILKDNNKAIFGNTRFIVETGRFVVGKAGVYCTKVIDKKNSFGENYIILNNTLNGFIRPSINEMIKHFTDDKKPGLYEPLFTDLEGFQYEYICNSTEKEVVTLVGNLCTGTDIIAKNIKIPKLEIGDIVVINNAGSYGAVLSPMQFATLKKPTEIYIHS